MVLRAFPAAIALGNSIAEKSPAEKGHGRFGPGHFKNLPKPCGIKTLRSPCQKICPDIVQNAYFGPGRLTCLSINAKIKGNFAASCTEKGERYGSQQAPARTHGPDAHRPVPAGLFFALSGARRPHEHAPACRGHLHQPLGGGAVLPQIRLPGPAGFQGRLLQRHPGRTRLRPAGRRFPVPGRHRRKAPSTAWPPPWTRPPSTGRPPCWAGQAASSCAPPGRGCIFWRSSPSG